jgi:outer membrane protein OmpA-like peptidoglycan-associated protein
MFNRRRYGQSKDLLLEALRYDEEFIEAYMMLGDLYFESKRFEQSAEYYGKAIELKPTFFSGNYYNHSRALYRSGQYDQASKQIVEFMSYPMRNEVVAERAKVLKMNIDTAMSLKSKPVPFELKSAGDGVNGQWEEFHPSMTVDGGRMFFTRKEPIGERAGRPVLKEDIFYTEKDANGNWRTALNMGEPINTRAYNEGAQQVSPDGRLLFLTICNKEDGMGSCDIYYSELHGSTWSTPTNLKSPINSNKWDAQPSLSSDGKSLFFASNRLKGKGGMDIWMSEKVGDTWSKPVNLPFNTLGNELTPFIHSDGKTLYFGSNGIPGMGGYDLFVVKKNDKGRWGKPVNLGYPINTHGDEHGMMVDPKGEFAYMSADREEGKKLDIYTFPIHAAAKPKLVTYAVGKVTDAQSGKGIEARFELIDLESGDIVVQSMSDDVNGRFLVSIPADRDYALNVSREGYLFHSENFSLKGHDPSDHYELDVELQPTISGNKVVLNNVFFESGSYELLPCSKAELNKLANYMKEHADLGIEIGGHTDDVGSDVNNQKLSENRANAVVGYLVAQGVTASNLKAKGYGESSPIANNSTEKGRALNRRIEAKVL